jgi:hypothetical protein
MKNWILLFRWWLTRFMPRKMQAAAYLALWREAAK